MEALLEEYKVNQALSGRLVFNGKIFRYKATQCKVPYGWFDLEIKNEQGKSIQIFFNPKRQHLEKEIKRQLKLYKWIK